MRRQRNVLGKNPFQMSLFPYFGKKKLVAQEVWKRFGIPEAYFEPFCGSGAVLFANPNYPSTIECINDIDGYLVNFWRAVKGASGEVAKFALDFRSELELSAKRRWLLQQRQLVQQLAADRAAYDAEIAGLWLFGICLSISSNWLSGNLSSERNYWQFPTDGGGFMAGMTVGSEEWLASYAARLKDVKILCRDWKRVVLPGALNAYWYPTAVFLDPPYSTAGISKGLYTSERVSSQEITAWCLERGDLIKFRIAVCGYDDEYVILEQHGWERFCWKGSTGLSFKHSSNRKKIRGRERIWFSPHCLKAGEQERVVPGERRWKKILPPKEAGK